VFKLALRADDGREETVVVTPNHPYLLAANDNGPGGVETVVQLVPGGGWTAAGFLKPGDQIRSVANGSLTVVAAELDRSKTRVYTLEVADSHTYAVGDLQAWVHNAKPTKPPAPGRPTPADGFEPGSGSGHYKYHPSAECKGWKDKKGNVWEPTDHKGTHRPHWDIQRPDGTHTPKYPR
jgi:hypothetical protein